MLKKVLLLTALSMHCASEATVIDLSLQTNNEYQVFYADNITGISTTETLRFAPENFGFSVNVDEESAGATVLNSIDAGQYVQHTATTEFGNFGFNAFSPFEDSFSRYLSDQFGVDASNVIEDFTSLDFSVFFNETTDANFVGGDVSIRFSHYFQYSQVEQIQNAQLTESTWLSGRIFLQKVNSLDEFNALSQLSLKDFLGSIDGSYTQLYTNYTILDSDLANQEPKDDYMNVNGFSFGTAKLRSAIDVPAPSGIALLVGGLLILVGSRKK